MSACSTRTRSRPSSGSATATAWAASARPSTRTSPRWRRSAAAVATPASPRSSPTSTCPRTARTQTAPSFAAHARVADPGVRARRPPARAPRVQRMIEADAPAAPPAGWSTRRVAIAIGVTATVALALLDALVRDEPAPKGDDLIYERMAQDPTAPHTFVFAYRIAVPWLDHVLPFGHTISFNAIAWICSRAAGGVVFVPLKRA